jgi:uncharacterized membrane protein YozB (DUF420 family)
MKKKPFAALFAVMTIAAVVGVAVAAAASTPHVKALSQTNIKITNSSLSFFLSALQNCTFNTE